MTPQPSVEGHREIVLRTSADVFENAAVQAKALAEVCPEYAGAVDRFLRLSTEVTAAAVTVGHKPRVRS